MKNNIKHSSVGDVFALKIASKKYPTYNGKYILFIKNEYDKELWDLGSFQTFYVKITTNKEIPKNKEEINKLVYIKTMLSREDVEQHNCAVGYELPKSDNFGYIYGNSIKVYFQRKDNINDFIFLGNFDIPKPENEFISINGYRGEPLYMVKNVIDEVIWCYENYNLKKDYCFTNKGHFERHQLFQSEIYLRKFIAEESERWKGREKEWLLSMGIDIDQEIKEGKHLKDSLTYVGPEEEKNIKKKKS